MTRNPAKPRGLCPYCARRCYVYLGLPPGGKSAKWLCRAHGYRPGRGGKAVPCPGANTPCAGDVSGAGKESPQ